MKIKFVNFKKEYPGKNLGNAFKRWFYIERLWSGKIINIGVKHWMINIDLRKNWIDDMIGGK